MESTHIRNVDNGFPSVSDVEWAPLPISAPPHAATDGMVGLQSLCAACQRLYPEQPNPLQVTARLKYWLGGPDPLDYISMYWNSGLPELAVPPHWHYISFGLSDLHGDGRVHPPPPSPPIPEHPSGLGLELTMRVAGEEGKAPTWPAALLQRLARYIFTTGNRLCVGDHVSWHNPLDGNSWGAIRQMLIGADPRLSTLHTPLGKVDYVQVVGVTDKELRLAQRCGGAPLLAALAAHHSCSPWLVTDMQRQQSVEILDLPQGPSDLSGVAASCRWETLELSPPTQQHIPERSSSEISQTVKEEIKYVLQRGLSDISSKSSLDTQRQISSDKHHVLTKVLPPTTENVEPPTDECQMSTDKLLSDFPKKVISNVSIEKDCGIDKDIAMSTDSFKMTDIENALLEEVMQQPPKMERFVEAPTCTPSSVTPSGVHLMFDKEAASLLPLALRGRVMHGAHFTWSAVGGAQAITLLGPTVGGALVSSTSPIAAYNGWLQVLVSEELALDMAEKLAELEGEGPEGEETTYEWPQHGLRISVMNTL